MKQHKSQSVQVVKSEEKQSRLATFILEEITNKHSSVHFPWSVLALSTASPVVGALRFISQHLDEATALDIRMILVDQAKHTYPEGFDRLNSLEVRVATNPRILDAHEQLVTGPISCWTGDCMRRDPSVRDAFEAFASGDDVSTHWAARSFEKIWKATKPLPHPNAISPARRPTLDELISGEPKPSETRITTTSRH